MTPKTVDTIDWPVIVLAGQSLKVRWTFYVQWLLSKRKVSVAELPKMLQGNDPGLVDLIMECFTAAVAENFTARKQPVPTPEYWAQVISDSGESAWAEVNAVIWAAVGKTQPGAKPTADPQPAEPAPLTN